MSQTVHSPQTPTSYEDAPLCALHKKVIAGGMLGQFSDGYILGSIGISMSLATTALALNSLWLGLIGAASLVGLMVGSFFMGPIADRIGRKPIFCTTMVVFTVASIMQFFVESASQLFILRLILGLALGADYAVGLTIVSEWSPARLRPRILSTLMIMWVSGYVSAYITGYFLQFIGDGSWRVILLSCAVPSTLAMYVRLGTPESPSWLISKGKGYKAEELVHKFIGAQYSLPGTSMPHPQKTSWSMLFSPQWKKNAIVGGTFFACQVIPYFSLSIFLPQIFKQLGMENPYASGIVFNLFLFMGVLVGTWLIDKISRRSFLISSFYICALALGLLHALLPGLHLRLQLHHLGSLRAGIRLPAGTVQCRTARLRRGLLRGLQPCWRRGRYFPAAHRDGMAGYLRRPGRLCGGSGDRWLRLPEDGSGDPSRKAGACLTTP